MHLSGDSCEADRDEPSSLCLLVNHQDAIFVTNVESLNLDEARVITEEQCGQHVLTKFGVLLD